MSKPSEEVLFHARCELEAMLIANIERARKNESPVYNEDFFWRLAEETRELFRSAQNFDTP